MQAAQPENKNSETNRIGAIAILIPCLNEERTIAEVVKAFRTQLPNASIFVFDNNSTDETAARAVEAGAVVIQEPRQGKGFVVQSMFIRVDADVYVMVDGDDTYPASSVHELIAPIVNREADMVVGSRLHGNTRSEFKQMNRLGNRLVLRVLNSMFGVNLTDILSGYRAFNRKFVKSIPVFGGGFEIETELTIKAITRGFRIVEVPTELKARPEGSHSKIRFFRDGLIIVNTILALFRDYKPLTFFGVTGVSLLALAAIAGVFATFEIIRGQTIARPVTAIVAVGLGVSGLLLLAVGLVLHSIARRSQEFEYQLQVLSDELRGRYAADHHDN